MVDRVLAGHRTSPRDAVTSANLFGSRRKRNRRVENCGRV